MRPASIFAIVLVTFGGGAARGQGAPLGLPSGEAKVFPVDSAEARIAEGSRIASKRGVPLLIVFGADWCKWCQRFWRTLTADPSVAENARRFEIVTVDVGGFDRNLSLLSKYGLNLKEEGIPYLVIHSSRGKVVNRAATVPFELGNGYDTTKLSSELRRWSQLR